VTSSFSVDILNVEEASPDNKNCILASKHGNDFSAYVLAISSSFYFIDNYKYIL